jgi:DNA-binding PadR family transcriptional regulator
MSEARLLSMLTRYPHPTALARHVRDGHMFATLRRLEARGLVTKRRGTYRLTRRGRDELELTELLTRLIARAAVGQCRS